MGIHKYQIMATLIAVLGFALIHLGAMVNTLFFLTFIGVWLVLGVYVWSYYKLRKETKKEIIL